MPTEITPELLCDLVLPEAVTLSPDGRRVAWEAGPMAHRDKHPERAVWVADSRDPDSARRWTWSGHDSDPLWSPDGTRLAFASRRGTHGTVGLYVLPADGGEAFPIEAGDRDVASFAWSPDGERLAFLAPDERTEDDRRREEERDDARVHGERLHPHRLYVVPVTEPALGPAHDAPDDEASGPLPVVDTDEHLSALAWSPDGSRLALVASPTPELDDRRLASVLMIDAETGEVESRVDVPSPNGLVWSGDGRHLAWTAAVDRRPQGASTVWTLPADGGQPRLVGPGEDSDRCVGRVFQRPGSSLLVAQVAHGLSSLLVELDPATGDWGRELYRVDGDLASAALTAGDAFAVVAGYDGMPGRVVTAGDHDPVVVSGHHHVLAGIELPIVEPITATATDGLPLDGVLVRSREVADAGPAPTVVVPHGGPYGRSSLTWNTSALVPVQLLAARGYAVLLPNYRGGFGHGHAFASAVRGDMGGAEWGDVLSLVDAAVDRGDADPDRLALGGWSQGGFLTAWGVTRSQRFRAGVIGAGPTDWNLMAATSDLLEFERMLGGSTPWDGPGPHLAVQRSPVSYAADCHTPVLILHGAEDQRVPVSQATGFHRALRDLGRESTLVTYPRAGHGVTERRHQLDLIDRWVTFLDDRL